MPKIRWDGDASGVARAQETMTKGVKGFKGEIKETVKEAKTLDAAARRISENANPQEKYNRKMAELKRLVDSGRISLKAAEGEAKKYGDALNRAGDGNKKAFSVEGLAQITRTGMAVMGITDALSLAVQGFKEFDEARRKAAEESMRSRQGVGQLAQLAASAKDKDGNATPETREAKYKSLLKEADSYLAMGAAADRNEAATLTFDLAAADLNKRDRKFAAQLRASGTLTDVGGLAQAYDAMRTAMGANEVGTFEQFTSKALAAGAAAPGTVQQLPVALSRAGSSAKALGLSDEFIISAGAILAKEAGSPEQGATKLAALLTGIQKSGKEKELKGLAGAQMIEKLATLPEKDLGYGGIFKDNAEAIAAFRTARSGIGGIRKLEADVFLAQSQGLGAAAVELPNTDRSQRLSNLRAQEEGQGQVIARDLGDVENARGAAIANWSNDLRRRSPGFWTEKDIFFEKMASHLPYFGDPMRYLESTQDGRAPIVGNDVLNEEIKRLLADSVATQQEILQETRERNGKIRSARATRTPGRPPRP